MNPYEIPDKATNMIMDVVSVRYAGDPQFGLKVEKAMREILAFVKTELRDAPESIDAMEILGEIIKEMKQQIRKSKGGIND